MLTNAQAMRLNASSGPLCIPNILLKSAFPIGHTSLNKAHLNADGLRPKMDEFRRVISGVAIFETHFKSYVTDKSVELKRYRLYRNDRPIRRKGGVAVYVRKDLRARLV